MRGWSGPARTHERARRLEPSGRPQSTHDRARRFACTDRGACFAMRARVLIRPKAGILDPQGEAVERALPALGFAGVANVHIGRLVELDVENPAQLESMCEKLLANPLVEDYEIVSADAATSR
jgi:phosphoribosylformylglycinamidine synthase subunit PurS